MLTNLGEVEKPMSAIPIIRGAISKLQDKPYQLTQLHCLLCQACLMSNNLKPALSLLDQDIYVLGTDEVRSIIVIIQIVDNIIIYYLIIKYTAIYATDKLLIS